MRNNILTSFIFILVLSTLTYAQNGGYQTYKFLTVNPSAKIAALGGTQVSQSENDVSIVLQNPALLKGLMHNKFSISYVNHISDASYGLVSFAQEKKFGTLGYSLLYFNGGKFIQTDETSTITGKFKVNEFALATSWSKKMDSVLTVGISAKYILSALENYRSQGLAFDFGATYNHPNKSFNAGFVVKNLGVQFQKYTTERANLPLDVQAGVSYKLEHVPFRISATAVQLNRGKLVYTDTTLLANVDPLTNQLPVAKKRYAANIANHLVLGGELLLSKSFNIRMGYNFKRRDELKLADRPSISGLSFGFGIMLSKWQFNFAFSRYHFYGNTFNFTLNFNIDNLIKSKV